MDKRVILAVAGSGKTTLLVTRLSLDRRALIVTYTGNNYCHLRRKIIEKFGYMPENITLLTYFAFLHGFCYRPLLQLQLKTRGLNFRQPSQRTNRIPRDNLDYYRDDRGCLYHNRLAKLLDITESTGDVIARIERFYDDIYVDEVQDFAGHDFNFLIELCKAKVGILFVGDFFQHTFDTSRDGPVNRTLHDDIGRYEKRFKTAGLTVDKEKLSRTWRCGENICTFIRTKLRIDIQHHERRLSEVITVNTQEQASELHADPSVVKLFYQEHHKYGCYSENWGASKGLDHFNDVCIVMGPKIWVLYQKKALHEAAPQTRNKLYVACSRARGRLFFMPEKFLKVFKGQ